jgi:hypothetical protein
MRQKSDKRTKRQERYMKFSEDYIQFLGDIHDTIREMIDAEFDRRGVSPDRNPHPENPPPEHAGREPTRSGQTHSQPTQSNQPNSKQHRHTFWQRLVSLFSLCL